LLLISGRSEMLRRTSFFTLTYSHAGMGNEAVLATQAAVELEGTYIAHWTLELVLHWEGQFDRAVEAGKMALAVSGRHPFAMVALATIYADWGKQAEAQAIYDELVARGAPEYIQPSQMAIAAAAAGDREKAVEHVREAYEIRDPMLIIAKYWPDFGGMRGVAGFEDIVERMGFSRISQH
jgi:tetratricopeptide (TPR) repeat protein